MESSELRGLWCDGFLPEQYDVDSEHPSIRGDVWIAKGRRTMEKWVFTLFLGKPVPSATERTAVSQYSIEFSDGRLHATVRDGCDDHAGRPVAPNKLKKGGVLYPTERAADTFECDEIPLIVHHGGSSTVHTEG